MSKQNMLKTHQTCVLRVNIQCDCDGCKHKIKKALQKIEGVYKVSVNVEQGKVSVTGNVEPATLIKKLNKSGKHAELWGPQKGVNSFSNNNTMQIHHHNFNKGGKDNNKSHHGDGKNQQKGTQQLHHHQMQNMKGVDDLKAKEQKSVKFNKPEYDDDDDDEDDDFDDDFDSDDDDDEFGGHHHGHHHPSAKMMSVMGAGGLGKKGGGEDMVNKGMGIGNNDNGKGGNQNQGKNGGFNPASGKNGGGKNTKGGKNEHFDGKIGGVKMEGNLMMHNMKQGGNFGPIGGMGQMGNHPMAQMRSFPAVQGVPAGSGMPGSYYQGGMGQGNSYNLQQRQLQQQYMGHMMMMRKQNGYGHEMYHPMMYPRSHPAVVYGPLAAQQPAADNFTHMFSDENANSCSVM